MANMHSNAQDSSVEIGQVFFEFQQIGAQIKVCAIQASTGIEVSIIAPTNISQQQMQQSALAKLRRRISQITPG